MPKALGANFISSLWYLKTEDSGRGDRSTNLWVNLSWKLVVSNFGLTLKSPEEIKNTHTWVVWAVVWPMDFKSSPEYSNVHSALRTIAVNKFCVNQPLVIINVFTYLAENNRKLRTFSGSFLKIRVLISNYDLYTLFYSLSYYNFKRNVRKCVITIMSRNLFNLQFSLIF